VFKKNKKREKKGLEICGSREISSFHSLDLWEISPDFSSLFCSDSTPPFAVHARFHRASFLPRRLQHTRPKQAYSS
jgi:hypothetical protein